MTTQLPADVHYPHRPRLLLVDDEAEILVALQDLFEQDFEIFSTTDPLEALRILRANPDIAVVVSDQRMPGLSGDAFLAQAREFSDAKAIVLTGYADLGSVTAALNQGRIQFYAHKPWEEDGLLAMVREAASHHRLERSLRVERMLLHGLMEHLPMRLAFTDEHGRTIRRNDRTETGEAEEAGASPWAAGLIGQMRARVDAVGRDEICAQNPETGRWAEIVRVALPWSDQGHQHPHAAPWQVSIERDVSERVQLQNEARQAEKMRALGTLAGGIAHDFNNLLAAIVGSLELLEDLIEDAPATRKLLDNATGSARRGAQLTRRLLDFSRPAPSALRAVDVVRLLDDMGPLLRQSMTRPAGGKAVACRVVVMPAQDVPAAWTDADQLEMAILNLCINARDAMAEGGEIAISVFRGEIGPEDSVLAAGDYVVLSVRDQGTGMAPDVAERVFEPFFTTKEAGRGTGLGLSTIFGFLRRHGSDIRVDTAPGEGTEVRLWLPAAAKAAQEETATEALPTTGLRVLVVDDEAMVRLVTEGFLRRDGHVVETVGSGEAALARLETGEQFDLAVIDLSMPGMKGHVCGAAMHARGEGAPAVLYVSGYADAQHWPEDGPVLPKPFTPEALREAIGRVMGKA